MSVRLKTFQFLPREEDGWGSPEYEFDKLTTLVTGENGAGKTPMLRGLALALGSKFELPQAIKDKSRAVRLVLDTSSGPVVVERSLGQTYATVTENGDVIRCTNEEEISEVMLRLLSIKPRSLVRRDDNQPVAAYVSVLSPIFFVDQDRGWRDVYEPLPNVNFLHEQREEALRWILDIPQRVIANARKEKDEAKRNEAELVEQLERKRRLVESLRREAGADGREGGRDALEAQRASVTDRLTGLLQSYDGLAKVDAALEAEARKAEAERDEADARLRTLERQSANLRQTHTELISQTSVLEANEIAANVFREFCGNEDCNLFRPQDSYGRRLLHLRDQLKDVDSTSSLLAKQIDEACEALTLRGAVVEQHQQRRRAGTTRSGGDTIVAAIESLTKEVGEISVRLDRLQRLDDERKRLAKLMEQAQRASERVTQLAGTRSAPGGGRLNDARTLLAQNTDKWLRALHTRHVGESTSFDPNLVPYIGGERFSVASSQSGSTRTRIVLALHAALIETSIAVGGHHPPFLILDAPKQQEFKVEDLSNFVTACEALFAAQRPPFQLIVGAKDPDIFKRPPDAVWRPTFKSGDELHYLG